MAQKNIDFWNSKAKELTWSKPWTETLNESRAPFYQWFVGGKTNITVNALDRHLTTETANRVAYIWEGEPGEVRKLTYFELSQEVGRMAALLRHYGVKKGDTVTIYMPLVLELPIAMLACARIGAIHSVIYGGFSVEALASRIEDAQSKVLITADGGFRRGKIVEIKTIAHEAMKRCPGVSHCLVVKRTGHSVPWDIERDHWYHEAITHLDANLNALALTHVEEMDAEDPLFILYTSGTTGKPKGLVHTHGGYGVYASVTHQTVFELQKNDRYWCTADPGWITGHSYAVYGPLINGTTVFLYEGAPNFPGPDRWWQMIERHGLTILYTSPTAIRGLMRFGNEIPSRFSLSTLRILGSVGEPINPEAWKWYHEYVGKNRCPIMDTWWQTETGGFMLSPTPKMKLKPGSATRPLFDFPAAIVDDSGHPVPIGQEGNLVLQAPWPGMARTIWKDPDRYRETYWKAFEKQGWYKTGDSARQDEDGYFWIIGRLDDVIKVSGYRLGTAEIESALVSHPSVAEAAAIGLPHEIKGQGIHAFVLLRGGATPSNQLEQELRDHVASEIGPIARPEAVTIVDTLPKTRSGKIMRRVLKARALGQEVGDISTLEE